MTISRSEIIGKTVFDMAPKEIAEKYDEKDRELLENPGTQQCKWKFPKNGGEERQNCWIGWQSF
jgi:hypothetical protein